MKKFENVLEKHWKQCPCLLKLEDFFQQLYLAHEVPVVPSYRNQSIGLRSKSIDWFLYEGSTGT